MTLAADEFIRRFLLARSPGRVSAHPPLRLSCQPLPLDQTRPLPSTPAPAPADRRAIRAAGGLSRPVPEAHRPILTRLPTLRQGTHAADRHLPRRLALTCTPTGYFVMLRFLSHQRLPSSVEFPADPVVLRLFAPLNKTVPISAPKCTLNPRPSHDTQPVHPRNIVCQSPLTSRRSPSTHSPSFNSHSSTTCGAA